MKCFGGGMWGYCSRYCCGCSGLGSGCILRLLSRLILMVCISVFSGRLLGFSLNGFFIFLLS